MAQSMIDDRRPSCRLAAVALCLWTQACSSPATLSTQTVRVETPGCAAARCELSNDRGSWQLGRTPGSVEVLVSGDALKVSCQAEGAAQTGTRAALARPGTSGVGGAVGGVVGGTLTGAALGGTALAVIPPLGVIAVLGGAVAGGVAGNAAESASQTLRYPGLISLPMSCSAGADAAAPGGVPAALGLMVRGLTRAEARARALGERSAVLVLAVAAAGRAAEAGLREGDVLLALNGRDLGDAADLEEHLLELPPTAALVLHVWREQRNLELTLTRAAKERP